MDSWDISALGVEAHHPEILRTDDHGRAIAIQLPAGEEMQEHRTHEAAYLMVVEGRVEIVQEGRSTAGGPGFFAHFQPAETREVRAHEDSRLVLLLTPWPGAGHHT